MNIIIDNLEDLKVYKRLLLLYSGGVDSTYALLWAQRHNKEVIAFRGHVSNQPLPEPIVKFLNEKQIKLVEKDLRNELVNDFISKGILAGGYYQNRFPISSSYSRPLIAKYAALISKENQCDCIIHTSNFHQNSAARFNNALMYHAPGTPIALPYIRSAISREQKLAELKDAGFEIEGSIYSIDENTWCRVIENNDLDLVQNPVSERHFVWTAKSTPPKVNTVVNLAFEKGIPVSIDNEALGLAQVVEKLNQLGSKYSIGRYNGVEDTPTGPKNHEVREAPAAEIIYKAKAFLESCALNQSELRLKNELDYRWCELVVNGNWYSLEKDSLEVAIKKLNEPVSGTISVLLEPGSVFPQAITSNLSLDFNSLEPRISSAREAFGYSAFYQMQSIHNQIRFF